jgi:hypothetical protein
MSMFNESLFVPRVNLSVVPQFAIGQVVQPTGLEFRDQFRPLVNGRSGDAAGFSQFGLRIIVVCEGFRLLHVPECIAC